MGSRLQTSHLMCQLQLLHEPIRSLKSIVLLKCTICSCCTRYFLNVIRITSTLTYNWQPSTLTSCFQASTAVTTPCDTQHIVLLQEDNSLKSNTNRFGEVESVDQSSTSAEQHSCEEHFTHNLTSGRLSYFNQYDTYSTWNISPLCRAKITRYWTQAGTRSRPQGPGPQLHGGVWRIKSHGTSNIPRREEYMLLFTTPSSLQGNKFHNKD